MRGNGAAALLVLAILVSTQIETPNLFGVLWLNQAIILLLGVTTLLRVFQMRAIRIAGSLIRPLRAVLLLLIAGALTSGIGIIRGTVTAGLALQALRDLCMGGVFFASLSLSVPLHSCSGALWAIFLQVSAVLAILQLGVHLLGWSGAGLLFSAAHQGVRVVGGFFGPNEYGAFLAMGASALLAKATLSSRGLLRVVEFLEVGVLWVGILYTASRGALVGAGLGVASVLLIVVRELRSPVVRRVGRAAGIVAMLVVAILAMSQTQAFMYFVTRFEWAERIDPVRISLFSAGAQMFISSPFVGYGLGGFQWMSRFYMDVSAMSAPHNDYVEFIVGGGLLLVVPFLCLFLGVARRGRRLRFQRSTAASVWVFLFVFLIQEFFFNYLTRPGLSTFFWFGIWVLYNLTTADREKPSQPLAACEA